MQISFFEEFPTKSNLAKLKLVSWSTKLYLGAKSATEFNRIKSAIKSKQVKEVIYWPLLEKKEGYWISPFSQRKALLRIFAELKNRKIPIMLDLELPATQNPLLYLTQSFNFCRNKKLITNFIQNYGGDVYLAEYYPEGKWKESIMKLIGLHYSLPKVKIIKMVYHSLHRFINQEFLEKEFKRGVNEYGKNYVVALGTIAPGIHGTEPKISLKQLQLDLDTARKCGIKEVVMFRLGGLDRRCGKVF
ncbi:hypothetical protein HZC30_06040 [Candidatus Woesearchaeota archaeon]|nr:hypothetical protein [Candidatus Woesearchaeota archaeon]